MRISDWSSDVCSSDLHDAAAAAGLDFEERTGRNMLDALRGPVPAYDMTADHRRILSIVILRLRALSRASGVTATRSEEHTSELQSLMRSSYAVFCLKNKTIQITLQVSQLPPQAHTNKT